jgi:tyrosine aminotransferase
LNFSLLKENAEIVYNKLKNLPGLTPRKPSGAMYLMVGVDIKSFPGIATDLDFVQALVREKSVFCLPAQVKMILNLKVTKNKCVI